MANSPLPPSEEALHWLDHYLASAQTPEQSLDLEALDGLLTALSCTPDEIMPAEWMPIVWGQSETESETTSATQIFFQDQEALQKSLTLITEHWQSIKSHFQHDEPLSPILFQRIQPCQLAQAWALGFLSAVALRMPLWAIVLQEPVIAQNFYRPILEIAAGSSPDPMLWLETLPCYLEICYKYWFDPRFIREKEVDLDQIFSSSTHQQYCRNQSHLIEKKLTLLPNLHLHSCAVFLDASASVIYPSVKKRVEL